MKGFFGKKLILLSIALFAVSISLLGCSQDNSTDEAEDTGAETRVVSTVKGDIEVPANPKRVVVDYFMGDVLALGVTPVGTTYVYDGAVFEDKLADVPSINGDDAYGEYSMEKVVDLNPDIIITFSETDYEKLSAIAPTIYVNYLELTTEERIRLIAEALGKEEAGEEVISEFDSAVEKAKTKLSDAGISDKTITLMETYNKELFVYGDKQGRGGEVLYTLLGLKAPEVVQNEIIGGEQYRSISLEVIDDYVGDMVMIGGWQEDPLDLVGNNSVWLATEAVQNNHVIIYDSSSYIYQDILSTTAQLNEITDSILKLYE